ncbi:hypothetical protein [Dyadobacter sp. CY312]|uniref:hypothetical protein n=1 Tax=Dyadobacter sp. CY312 TaxID=2907303 RepID=UPI001F375F81|nr:hypothetical protein [Dyadobacter sp. CY312]MCE7042377.1 hypothetical protein [Dyadobacter sp. CY312]
MKYIYTFSLLIFVIACKKTDIEQLPEFPSTLYLNGITKKSKLHLYSDGKEITDPAVISKFVKTNGGFAQNDTSLVSDEHFTFFSTDSAGILNTFPSLIVTKNGEQFLFKSTNRIITSKEAIETNFNMAKYKSEAEPVWDSKWSTYHMLVGYGNYTELKLSTFEYKRVKWYLMSGYFPEPILQKSSTSGTKFNEFDQSYISKVGKNDTLAIQEYFYTFKKR